MEREHQNASPSGNPAGKLQSAHILLQTPQGQKGITIDLVFSMVLGTHTSTSATALCS